jgi:Gpi18-like mannosyltransferase
MTASVRSKIPEVLMIFVGVGLALLVRLSLLDFKSIDYFNYTKVWYNALRTSGFSAFGQGFSNYNLPYLYLLYFVVRLFPDTPAWIAVKIPSLIADFVAAGAAYGIVRARYKDSPLPLFSAFAVLFAPTVILNSAFWGQADAVYASALLVSLYFLVRRRDVAAMLLFGVAFAFKAQALFVAPLLLSLLLRREIRWRTTLLVPLIMALALIPALLAGRPLMDLLLIYPSQAGQYEQLSMHAASALSWIPESGRYYPYFYPVGLIAATTAAIAYTLAVWKSAAKITPGLLVELALLSTLMMPFLLPKMHERYFFVADILSLIFAFYVPGYFFVPLGMIGVSFFAYQPALFGAEPASIGLLALVVFLLLAALSRHALSALYPTPTKS